MEHDLWRCDVCCRRNDGGTACKFCTTPRGVTFEDAVNIENPDEWRRFRAEQETKFAMRAATRAKWKERVANGTALRLVRYGGQDESFPASAQTDQGGEKTKSDASTPPTRSADAPSHRARQQPQCRDISVCIAGPRQTNVVIVVGPHADDCAEDHDVIDLTGLSDNSKGDANPLSEEDADDHSNTKAMRRSQLSSSPRTRTEASRPTNACSAPPCGLPSTASCDTKLPDETVDHEAPPASCESNNLGSAVEPDGACDATVENNRHAEPKEGDTEAKEDDDAVEAYTESQKLWECSLCYHYNAPAIKLCPLCGTPGGLTFTQVFELERMENERAEDAELLTEDAVCETTTLLSDTKTCTGGTDVATSNTQSQVVDQNMLSMLSSQNCAAGWTCGVCHLQQTSRNSICDDCGTQGHDSLRDSESLCEEGRDAARNRSLPPPQATRSSSATSHDRLVAQRSSKVKKNVGREKLTSKKKQERCTRITRRPHTTRGSPEGAARLKCMDARWPCAVASLRHQFNPMDIRFGCEPPFGGKCDCDDPCRHNTCRNGKLGFFCLPNCCKFDGNCGNAITESKHLRLARRRGTKDLTVLASGRIDAGVIIGEYLGLICVGDDEDEPSSQLPKRQNEYRFRMKRKSRSHPAKKIYVDAEQCGGITRFLNHSCTPTAQFHEASNGTRHTVVVVTSRAVQVDEEVTVNYGDQLWFICRCGEPTCCHKNIQHLSTIE